MSKRSKTESLTTEETVELSEVKTAPSSQVPLEVPAPKEDSQNFPGIDQVGLKLDHDSYRHFWDQGRDLIEPNNEFIANAVQRLNKKHWSNVKDFLQPWGWQEVTIIHLAAYQGKVDVLERAVALYASTPSTVEPEVKPIDPLLAMDKLGRCALHYAASEGHSGVVSWILKKFGTKSSGHPQLSLEDVFGRTPLHDAAGSLHVDIVKLLVDAGAAVNLPNRKGVPPYLPAASDVVVRKADLFEILPDDLLRYERIVRIFIGKKVDVNLQYPKEGLTYGWTMLYYALFLGSKNATRQLLEYGALQRLPSIANPKTEEQVLVFAVRFYRNLDCIRALVDKGGSLATKTPALDKDTVLEELLTYLEDKEAIAFFMELLDERVRSTRDEKESVILGYETLLSDGEPQMALVGVMMKTMNRSELQTVLQHPLLQAYVEEKWLHISLVFYIFLALYTIFVISLSGYAIDLVCNKRDPAGLRFFIFALASIFFCHNLQQFTDEPMRRVFRLEWHIRHSENWLMFISLTISMTVAIAGTFIPNVSTNWVLRTLGVAVPLSWIQIVLFLGRIPAVDLLDVRYYALLFSMVLRHVFKVLFIGSLIVIGFSVGFFVLLKGNDEFEDPLLGFAKTIIMMTGEFNYNELFNLSDNTKSKMVEHVIIGRILFIIFVIVMNIVFMNLTIGLVISDIQALEKQGQCNRLLQRGKFITDFEYIAKYLRSRIWVPECLKKWLRNSAEISSEGIVTEDTQPTLWKDICTVVQRKDRREKSRIMNSRANNKPASLVTIQSTVDAIESSQQNMMHQIQQLMQDRSGGSVDHNRSKLTFPATLRTP